MNKRQLNIVAGIGLLVGVAVSLFASDITANLTLKVDKGYLSTTKSVSLSAWITNAAPNVAGGSATISTNTVGTALPLGSVVTNGWAWFRNLDASNYVEIGVQDVNTNFLPLIRLNYGDATVTRLAQGVTPCARANVASVVLEYQIFDN